MAEAGAQKLTLTEHVLIRSGAAVYWGTAILVLILLILPTFVIIPMSFTSTSFLIFPPRGFPGVGTPNTSAGAIGPARRC